MCNEYKILGIRNNFMHITEDIVGMCELCSNLINLNLFEYSPTHNIKLKCTFRRI